MSERPTSDGTGTPFDQARDRLKSDASDQASAPYRTISEAAELARCDQKTLRRAVTAGDLRAFRPAGRLLFLEADVREWVESRPARRAASRPRRRSRRRAAPGSVQAIRELERSVGR